MLPLKVVTTTQPTGEGLPMLVRADTWVPVSLATRWAVYARRFEVAESTLRGDLSALRYLYAWGDRTLPDGLEPRLAAGPLSHGELLSLRDFLRAPDAELGVLHLRAPRRDSDTLPVADTAVSGTRVLAALQFLRWAISPANRNERGAEPHDARAALQTLEGVLGRLASRAGKSGERPLPPDAALQDAEALLRPRMTSDGRFCLPLSWGAGNPFSRRTRLRNWLMWCLARDCGLRIGEILSLKVQDFSHVDGVRFVLVPRRPDDPDDSRTFRPASKTLSRPVPLSPHADFALNAYLRDTGPGARRRGTPYLVTAAAGRPLSAKAAAAAMSALSARLGIDVSWHVLRHAWATEYARNQLAHMLRSGGGSTGDDVATEALIVPELRELGGWSPTSQEPMRYARRAIREHALRNLHAQQEARAIRIGRAALAERGVGRPD